MSDRPMDSLAQFIRMADGRHELGAGALAERIAVEWLPDLLAEAERRGAERGWDDALDHAGDESHDLRINLCGETDWSKVDDLLWSHLEAIADANPYRAGADQ